MTEKLLTGTLSLNTTNQPNNIMTQWHNKTVFNFLCRQEQKKKKILF